MLIAACMNKVRRLFNAVPAAMVCAGMVLCSFAAHAEVVDYAKIGWWSVVYKKLETVSGCEASVLFQDQTMFRMALIQSDAKNIWIILVSNPTWSAWIGSKKEHKLWLVTNKPWQGVFAVTDDKKTLFLVDAAIGFMNSVADARSLTILDDSQRLLTASPLDMKDSAAAIQAVVRCVQEHPAAPAPPPQAETVVSGTGFFVAPNFLITNNHVTEACKEPIQVRFPERNSHKATISGQDKANDLALLHTDMDSPSVASFRFRIRLGEAVATYGFPYPGVLSSGGNFTLGNVTSLTGINDDTRFLQTSTPMQPGNSGGPLLDMSGNVVGVVVGQLDALQMMQAAKSVPQNINFAIQAPIIANFLSAKGVAPKVGTQGPILPPSDVADIAKKFTVQVYCKGTSPKAAAGSRNPGLSYVAEGAELADRREQSAVPHRMGDVKLRLTRTQVRQMLDTSSQTMQRNGSF